MSALVSCLSPSSPWQKRIQAFRLDVAIRVAPSNPLVTQVPAVLRVARPYFAGHRADCFAPAKQRSLDWLHAALRA